MSRKRQQVMTQDIWGSDSDDSPSPNKKRRLSDKDWAPGGAKKQTIKRPTLSRKTLEGDQKVLKRANKSAPSNSEPPKRKPKKEAVSSSTSGCSYSTNPKTDNQTSSNDVEEIGKEFSDEEIIKDISDISMLWSEADVLAERERIDYRVAQNLIKLFKDDNTIPFIARYRKEVTNNMEPEQLRHAKESYDEILNIKSKAGKLLQSINKLGKLNDHLQNSITCARTIEELDHIGALFKTGSKKTLAERAKQLGLEAPAQAILSGSEVISIFDWIDAAQKGRSTQEEVQLGIQHIIADLISKDCSVLDKIRELRNRAEIRLESSKAKSTSLKETIKKSKQKNKIVLTPNTSAVKKEQKVKNSEESKFSNYFEFSSNVKFIKPHQVLAINRGENLKELSVRIAIPEYILQQLLSFCKNKWLSQGQHYELRSKLLDLSVKDSYARLIQPLISRQVRSELNQAAERASIEVFSSNLRELLLMPPYRGHAVLGIDPGYKNGCKIGLVSKCGVVLETGVLYLHASNKQRQEADAVWLRDILRKHSCEVIALGNGTACRETEEFVCSLIQSNWFQPLDVSYTIVNEQGASIYSCGEEAKKEFPKMDPNIISAISLARRIQDPLTEMVKVEPRHLGVGMYQHDVSEKKLSKSLDEIVVECVSFVGVDLNTAPHCLLRRIAGLNASRADKIIEHRNTKGGFTNRQEIKGVKGIGGKTFEQCAGFIRIIPETIGPQRQTKLDCNPLDRTWIHPESYQVAHKVVNFCGTKIQDFGSSHFNKSIADSVRKFGGISSLATKVEENETLVKLIVEGLQLPPNHDLRSELQKPLFRKNIKMFDDLNIGEVLTGRVTNITHFGAFVDIGVGTNGLIPLKYMNNMKPRLSDRVEIKVISLELQRKRIGLQLLKIC